MRERLIELIKEVKYTPFKDGGGLDVRVEHQLPEHAFEAIADHLLAEGVIVPPCKVADVVYRVSFAHKTVEMLKVEGFVCNLTSRKVHCTHFMPSWLGNQKEHFYISFSSFGKTVFLTIEEAEKALAERSKK